MKRPALFLLSLLSVTAQAAEKPRPLTLQEARTLVLERHPGIHAAQLTARATGEIIRQHRAAYLPQLQLLGGSVITTQDEGGVNIVTDSLQMPGVNDRASVGFSVSQLITDFGRTSNLTASSRLRALAEEQNAQTTRAQILLETDAACLGILQAAALLDVAEQTVKTRTVLRDNIVSMQKSGLKSSLDVSFAEVNLQDAELLLSRARNDLLSAQTKLARLLLDPEGTSYRINEPAAPPSLPKDARSLVAKASGMRPELASLRLAHDAAQRFVEAEKALSRPRLSLQGSAGALPWRDKSMEENYVAAGILLSWPLSTGGLNSAKQREAQLRAEAADQALKNEEARVARDVQIAWLNASNALERLGIAKNLREQSSQSYALAEARFQTGSSGIVELSQAQLNLTAAEIRHTTTRYEYLLHRSILDYEAGAMLTTATAKP